MKITFVLSRVVLHVAHVCAGEATLLACQELVLQDAARVHASKRGSSSAGRLGKLFLAIKFVTNAGDLLRTRVFRCGFLIPFTFFLN